jgi:hypothetical protein
MPGTRLSRQRPASPATLRLRPAEPASGAILAVAVAVLALAAAVLGVGRLLAASGGAGAAPPAGSVTISELTTQVTSAGWAEMDHDMATDAPGYQMPPAMMPGMPTGDDQRLSIAVTVVNNGDATRPLQAGKEFVLHGKNGQQWAPHSDTFGDLPRLAPHNAVSGVIFFDLPPAGLTDSPIWLEWSHQGRTARLTIPLAGMATTPEHSHHP